MLAVADPALAGVEESHNGSLNCITIGGLELHEGCPTCMALWDAYGKAVNCQADALTEYLESLIGGLSHPHVRTECEIAARRSTHAHAEIQAHFRDTSSIAPLPYPFGKPA